MIYIRVLKKVLKSPLPPSKGNNLKFSKEKKTVEFIDMFNSFIFKDFLVISNILPLTIVTLIMIK